MSSYTKRSADSAGLTHGETRHKSSRIDDDLPPKLSTQVAEKLKSLYAEGVVQEGDIDDRALSQLGEFSSSAALDILDQFASCDMSTVRNKSAYLSGVMQRMRKFGGGRDQERDPVQRKLQQLISSGVMKRGDLDQRCLEALGEVSIDAALLALDRFASRGLSDVRNPSAFFMSTLKKVDKEYIPSRSQSSGQSVNVQSLVPGMGGGLLGPMNPGMLLPGAVSLQPPPVPGPLSGGLSLAYGPFDALQPANLQATGYVSQQGPMVSASHLSNSTKVDYGNQQRQFGVRVDEFWNLSEFARHVHPAPALKLQQLWDDGVRLVSLLDDRAWEVLAELGAAEGLIVVEDVAAQLQQPGELRNVNAFFMSVAKGYLAKNRSKVIPQAPVPHERSRSSSDRDRSRGEGFHLLPSLLADKVEDLIAKHPRYLSKKHFDEGVVEMLNRLSTEDALDSLAELENNDLSSVRNMPAYIMGICRRYNRK